MFSRFRIPEPARLVSALVFVGIVAAAEFAAQQCLAKPLENGAKQVPSTAEDPLSVPVTKLFPGGSEAPPVDPASKQYLNNAKAIADGAQLFNWMNCSGCHFHGAGGMGPPFMNGGHFIYGGRLDQIFASIYQGRPNGMPSWGQKLPAQQIWALAAYVKALSEPSERDKTGAPPMQTTKPKKDPPPNPATPTNGSQK